MTGPADDTDRELIERIAGKDRSAFDILFRRYYPRLFRFISGTVNRTDLIDEIINDTMVVIWQRADSFAGRSRVSSWIMGIAWRRTLKSLEQVRDDRKMTELDEETLVAADTPEDAAGRSDLGRLIRRSLAALSADHRAVVELTYFHGYRYREIAEIMNCPEATVKTRMLYARQRLRGMLGALAPERESEAS